MKILARGLVLALICAVLARKAADFLVVEQLHKADVIVVLGGDSNDVRYTRGLELLRSGYAPRMFVDESEGNRMFGHTDVELAQRFIAEDPTVAGNVSVCPTKQNSTDAETKYVEDCVSKGSTVLLVTSNYHTRRAFSIFRTRLPDHTLYIAAAPDPQFGSRWWEHREWAKTTLTEWQKLLWWELVERWR
jgi:uncharacterized SAM-binding protein YcdF (DUF218 family)